MQTHPAALLGWLTIAIGFTMLLAWVPTEVPPSSFSMTSQAVFNSHKASISQAVIIVGGILVLVGVLEAGFSRLQLRLPANDNGSSTAADFARNVNGEELNAPKNLVKIKDRQGKIRQLNIKPDGSIVAETMTGLKTFHSLDDAKAYFN